MSPCSTQLAEQRDERLATNVLRAALLLTVRQGLVLLVGVAGGVLLARSLRPAEFGVYVVMSTLGAFLTLTGDLGLAGSLVRQPEAPSTDDVRSVLTVQLVLGSALMALVWWLGPLVAGTVGAPSGTGFVTRCAAVAVGLTALQSVATAQLERDLRFAGLGMAEVVQALAFNVAAVTLARRGDGVRSFGLALVLEACVGCVIVLALAREPLRPTAHLSGVRGRLAFGLPFIGSSAVSLAKDAVSPVFIGLLLGARDVGLVEWAVGLAAYPLIAVMVLQRVFLPAFARLQADPPRLAAAVEQVVRVTNLVAVPLSVITLVLARPATPLVFGARWLPGLPIYYLLWSASLVVPTAAPLLGLLNAIGASTTVFRWCLWWMAATWTLTVPAVLAFGRLGFGVANMVVQCSTVLLIRRTQRRVPFRVVSLAWRSWAGAALTGLLLFSASRWLVPRGMSGLVCEAAGGVIACASITLVLQKDTVVDLVLLLRGRTGLHGANPSREAAA